MKHKLQISVTEGLWKVSWLTNAGTVVLTFTAWEKVNFFVTALNDATELDTDEFSNR